MDQRRAYEQLTGDYRPSGIARVLGIADSTTTRYVPVMDGGQIVGSLSVDASGNPVAYTGSRPENATIMDPTINKEAAMGLIRGPKPLSVAPRMTRTTALVTTWTLLLLRWMLFLGLLILVPRVIG